MSGTHLDDWADAFASNAMEYEDIGRAGDWVIGHRDFLESCELGGPNWTIQ